MKVEQIYTSCLSQGAYFIESNGEAAAIDPLREVSNYLKLARNSKTMQLRPFSLDALYKDLRKPNEEVITTEITPTLLNIKQVLRNLKQWMKDEYVPTPITMVGMSSYVKYESKGNILMISPWNYPVFLSLYPLIYAIAGDMVNNIA